MIQPVHHSIADWDKSSTDFALSAARYTSAPTSLRSTENEGPRFLCNHPSTLCIPEGRILCQTWCDDNRSALGQFSFRNQCPTDQVPDFQNCYLLQLDYLGPRVWEYVNGRIQWTHDFGLQLPREKWVNVEITWWNYPPYDSKHPLAIQFRAYYAGSWHDYGRAENENARWYDSAINRVGLRPFYNDNYFDDTEIHAPVWPPPGVKMNYTSIFSEPISPPTEGAWFEWDLSAIIPAEATVVEVSFSAAQMNIAGVRPFGSTINRVFSVGIGVFNISRSIQCEVGTDRKIEIWRTFATDVSFLIAGYWIPQ